MQEGRCHREVLSVWCPSGSVPAGLEVVMGVVPDPVIHIVAALQPLPVSGRLAPRSYDFHDLCRAIGPARSTCPACFPADSM